MNELGARRDGRLDDVAREEDPVAGRVERQPVLEQPPAHLRAADLHPDLGQDAHRLVDDPRDELGARGCSGTAACALLGSVPGWSPSAYSARGTSASSRGRSAAQRSCPRWSGNAASYCLSCRA